MDGLPADVPAVVIALLVVSAAVLGVVLSLPSEPPPDAERVAVAVDEVAASNHAMAKRVPLEATAIRVEPTALGLRNAGGTARAPLHYGPVTPVSRGSVLSPVLHGQSPETAFDTPWDYWTAVERASSTEHTWESAGDELVVRRVEYGGIERVLVGQ